MRQITIIAPLLFLLLFILYFFTPDFSVKIEHEMFVDEDVLLFVTQNDLDKRIEEFSSSHLGSTLAGIDFLSIAEELNSPSFDGEKIMSIKQTIQQIINNPLFKILFGKEVTVALTSFKPDSSMMLQEQIINNLLLIGRPKQPAKLIDLLTKLVPTEDEITEAHYGGHVIKRFPLDAKHTISAARVKDLFVFSGNETMLRKGLDLYDNGGAGSLAQRGDYLTRKSAFNSTSLFGYVNISKIYRSVYTAFEPLASDKTTPFSQELEKYRWYRSGYFGAWKTKDTIKEKAIVDFESGKADTVLAGSEHGRAARPATLSRIADDSALYYWNSTLDIDTFMSLFNLLGGHSERLTFDDIIASIGTISDMDHEEIRRLFDQDMTVALKGIPENQFVPIPSCMLAVKVNDMVKMKTLVTKILDYYSIPVRELKIEGADAFSWGGVVGMSSLKPTLAFVDDYLVFTTNLEQLKEFIAMPAGKLPLNEGTLFKRVDAGLSGENKAVAYVNVSEIATMLKELVSWGGTMIAIKDRDVASKSKLLIDRLINPLLDGLTMYSVIGTRNYVEGETIVFESTTVLDNEKR